MLRICLPLKKTMRNSWKFLRFQVLMKVLELQKLHRQKRSALCLVREGYSPEQLTYLLKIDGWKMTCSFEMVRSFWGGIC